MNGGRPMLTQDDVIYFIVTDRFFDGTKANNQDVDKKNPTAFHGGDFEGIRRRIPYLKELGITALWMTPVFLNTSIPEWNAWGYHGYWPLDFERIDPHFHTPSEEIPDGSRLHLKMLVDDLHCNGIKVILDMVSNHVGYNHPLFLDDSGYVIKKSWFNQGDGQTEQKKSLMGLPDLDQDNVEVGDYFIGIILDWIAETGIDCIRFDAVKNVESIFWQRVKTYIKGKYPGLTIIGEVLDFDSRRTAEYQNFYDFDTVFDFPLQQSLVEAMVHDRPLSDVLARPEITSLERHGVLNDDFLYANHNRLITLLDNHDTSSRFITLLSDRYGNDSASILKSYKMALTLLFALRGIPQLYYGDEIGLAGGPDPDNRRDMPWDIMEGEDCMGGPDEKHPFERAVFQHIKALVGMQKENESLRYGASITLYSDSMLFVFIREFRSNAVIVALNNGHDDMPVPMAVHLRRNSHLSTRLCGLLEGKQMKDAFGESESIRIDSGLFTLRLRGKTAAVYCQDQYP